MKDFLEFLPFLILLAVGVGVGKLLNRQKNSTTTTVIENNTITVNGVSRPMTEEEVKATREGFAHLDKAFEHVDRAFKYFPQP